MSPRLRVLFLTAASMPVVYGAPTFAQTAARASDAPIATADGFKVQEVTVTARRRRESLERVPVTVTALSSAQLAERQIHTEADLQLATPGLTVKATENRNTFNYSIRGQTVDYASNSLPGVLSYINEFQMSTVASSSLYDLASVQVLKGPQGTLFGRNATGGAVLLETVAPSDKFEGFATARLGNYSQREFLGAVNLPISDALAVRLAFDTNRRDGYVHNLVSGQDINEEHSDSIRASLRWKPSADFSTTFTGQYDRSRTNGDAFIGYSANPVGSTDSNGNVLVSTAALFYSPTLDAVTGVPGSFQALLNSLPPNVRAYAPNGGILEAIQQQKRRSIWDVALDSPLHHESENWYIMNQSSAQVTSDVLVKNIIGYARSTAYDVIDQEGTAFPLMSFPVHWANEQYSEEFQVQGSALRGALNYIGGVYYSWLSRYGRLEPLVFTVGPVAGPILGLPSNPHYTSTTTNRSEALFGQVTYHFSQWVDGLSATAGYRYTWEQVGVTEYEYPGVPPGIKSSSDSKKPSWEVGLQYQVNSDLMLYVTQRGSWRSGGFNTFTDPRGSGPATAGGNEYSPETTKDVEIGAKYGGRVSGIPVRLNVSLFNQKTTNMQHAIYAQLPGGVLGTFTINAPGDTRFRGAEVDTQVSPTDWLTAGLNVAYIDAEQLQPDSVNVFGNLIKFDTFADTPTWSGAVFADVKLPLPDEMGSMSLHSDMYAQTDTYFSVAGKSLLPGTNLPAYQIVNFRLSWNDIAQSKISIAAFLKNAFNRQYYLGGVATGTQVGTNQVVPGYPRFFGVELSARF